MGNVALTPTAVSVEADVHDDRPSRDSGVVRDLPASS
jgi:hypothetical protein